MSYTKHTWTTGETIIATKMNNIEEGIVEASQSGGGAFVTLTFSGFSGSHPCGAISYFKQIDNIWKNVSLYEESWYKIGNLTIVEDVVIPPEDSGIVVAWYETESWFNSVNVSVDGGISDDTFSAYYQGNSTSLTCYPITGSGTISVIAD
ncbi:MAG: hypothetical protein IKF42_04270 [Mogibacterium sp.]|nr:hypothetical protein [Mogibacterium sp.]